MDFEESDVFDLDADVPLMKQVDHEEYRGKVNIPLFNGNLPIKEFVVWLSEIK